MFRMYQCVKGTLIPRPGCVLTAALVITSPTLTCLSSQWHSHGMACEAAEMITGRPGQVPGESPSAVYSAGLPGQPITGRLPADYRSVQRASQLGLTLSASSASRPHLAARLVLKGRLRPKAAPRPAVAAPISLYRARLRPRGPIDALRPPALTPGRRRGGRPLRNRRTKTPLGRRRMTQLARWTGVRRPPAGGRPLSSISDLD